MEPAFPTGRLLRSGGRPSSVARGDVVVFRVEGAREERMKRVVGLPGECVAWDGQGRIWINEQPLEEPYARFGPAVPGDEDRQRLVLGDGDYFVAGDTRLYSRDSRQDGAVHLRHMSDTVCA